MPTFNQKVLNEFVEIFTEKSEILVKQLENVAGKGTFDVFTYVSRCTLDIICGKILLPTNSFGKHRMTSSCYRNGYGSYS